MFINCSLAVGVSRCLRTKLFLVPGLCCVQVSLGLLFSHWAVVWRFSTPRTAARQASLSFTISRSLLKLLSIKSMMPSNHLILCCPLLLPSISASIRVFPSESALCIRWPKYWSFSFSINPSNDHSRLLSFRIDCFYFLAVQGTLKSLLQHELERSLLSPCLFQVRPSEGARTLVSLGGEETLAPEPRVGLGTLSSTSAGKVQGFTGSWVGEPAK